MDKQLQSPKDNCSSTVNGDSLVERAMNISNFGDAEYASDEELVEFLRNDIHNGNRKYVDRLFPILQTRCSKRIRRYLTAYPYLSRDPIEAEVLSQVTDLLLDVEVPQYAVRRFGQWFKRRFIDVRRNALHKFKSQLKEQQDAKSLSENTLAAIDENALDSAILVEQLCEQLTKNEWELTLMYYFHGLKRKEITKVLGCADKTTYNRLNKLETKINEILQGGSDVE